MARPDRWNIELAITGAMNIGPATEVADLTVTARAARAGRHRGWQRRGRKNHGRSVN